ncbi:MAG: hypothetical protein V4590_11640 [Bacteroidota bacterium]
MTILTQLSSALNRRDEVPNQELAKQVAVANDTRAVQELVENLANKNTDIQSDCIKVLYEIGTLNPILVAGFADAFVRLLDSKNNRLQWGAMTALHSITTENPKAVYSALAKIIAVADKGSVITNDHCVGILIKLCSVKTYATNAFTLLIERLMIAPTNQLPMYAEQALPVVTPQQKALFIKTLTARLGEIEKESKRKRVEKVIGKPNKL